MIFFLNSYSNEELMYFPLKYLKKNHGNNLKFIDYFVTVVAV